MVKHARFSNMPLLAKNRRFNQTKDVPSYNESIITIQIDDFNNWKITTNKSGQYIFSYIVSDLKGTHKDIQIHLPHIELARVLFFHNAYLSKAALDQRKLTTEYYIVPEEHQTIIHVHEFCAFHPINMIVLVCVVYCHGYYLILRHERLMKVFPNIFE
jgi:hypothetical protein